MVRKAQRASDRRALDESIDTENVSDSSYMTPDENEYSGSDDKVVAYVKNWIPRYKKRVKRQGKHRNENGSRLSNAEFSDDI